MRARKAVPLTEEGRMRPAGADDIPALLDMMTDFYAESGYTLDRAHAERAFKALLGDPRLGRIWIVQHDADDVGYVVVTFVFGMEYGGLMAVVDDFFVRAAHRDVGLGTAALAEVRGICSRLGVRAVSVEVGRDNPRARKVYSRTGFAETDHLLMTLRLAGPSHVE
jgi:GNAT superfamily N-acetyltransferase